MTAPHVSVITLGVSNLARSIAFYEAMGLQRAAVGGPGVAVFDLGGAALALCGWDRLAEDAGLPPQSAGFRGVTLGWRLPDRAAVDLAMARAQTSGAEIVKPAGEAFWGGYSGYIADPDDHLWEIAHNPFWTVRPDGALERPAPADTSETGT